MGIKQICLVDNCEEIVYAKNLCRHHYDKMRNYDNPLHRTKNDKNIIISHKDFAEIVLQNTKEKAIIDIEDIEKIKQYKWYKNREGYVLGIVNGDIKRLHRFLLDANNNINIIDHKDRNKLNNRKLNLRYVTQIENSQNRGIQSNNKSGVVGVIWHKTIKKWYAYITINKKTISLGTFNDLQEAKECRIAAEKKYFGKYRSNANGEIKC